MDITVDENNNAALLRCGQRLLLLLLFNAGSVKRDPTAWWTPGGWTVQPSAHTADWLMHSITTTARKLLTHKSMRVSLLWTAWGKVVVLCKPATHAADFLQQLACVNKPSSLCVVSRRLFLLGVWNKSTNERHAADRQISCHDSPSSKYLDIALAEVKGLRRPAGLTWHVVLFLGSVMREHTTICINYSSMHQHSHTQKTSFPPTNAVACGVAWVGGAESSFRSKSPFGTVIQAQA